MTSNLNEKKAANRDSNYNWSKYIGFGSQLIVGLLITLFVGKKLDAYLNKHSFFAWLTPSLFILVVLISVVRDTQNKK
jgi:uncharacterized membrane protein